MNFTVQNEEDLCSHVVFRSWCRHCVSGRAREDPHRRIATHEGRTPKVMLDWMFWMFFTSDQEPGVQLPVLVVYDLSTGAVMAIQSTKDSSVETVAAVAQDVGNVGTLTLCHTLMVNLRRNHW